MFFFLNKSALTVVFINNFMIMSFFILFNCLLIFFLFFFSFFLGTSFKMFNLDFFLIYECGFSSFNLSKQLFTIQFYLIALIFLIFDMEITFLLPWIFVLMNFNFFTIYYNGLIFLFFILIGVLFEFKYQVLIW